MSDQRRTLRHTTSIFDIVTTAEIQTWSAERIAAEEAALAAEVASWPEDLQTLYEMVDAMSPDEQDYYINVTAQRSFLSPSSNLSRH